MRLLTWVCEGFRGAFKRRGAPSEDAEKHKAAEEERKIRVGTSDDSL